MLNEDAYVTALWAYIGSAVLALLCTAWWLRRSWRPSWLTLLVLTGAALLLTPAFPEPGMNTLAPALIVAAFQLMTSGAEAARHALLPLGVMVALAIVVTLLLRVFLFRRPDTVVARPANDQAVG